MVIANSFGQTTQTKTESYDGGTLTYDYYIDNESSEMVKHGSFKYEKHIKNTNPVGSLDVSINGKFKNGNRDGIFEYKINSKDFPNSGGTYTTKNETGILTYKEGVPNGKWQISGTIKTRDWKFNGLSQNYTWTDYDKTNSELAETFFINGTTSKTLKFKKLNEPQTYTFELNNDGFLIGNYNLSDVTNNFELNFNNDGILTTKIISNKYSNEVDNKTILSQEDIKLANDYFNGNITKEELLSKRIKVDTITNGLGFLGYNHLFESELFLLDFLGGDKTLDDNRVIGRSYLKFIRVEKFELINYKENTEYKMAINGRNSDEKKVKELEEFISRNSFRISENDLIELKKEVDNLKDANLKKNQAFDSKNEFYEKRQVLKNTLDNINRFTFTGHFSYISMNALKAQSTKVLEKKNDLKSKYFKGIGSLGGESKQENDEIYIEKLKEIKEDLSFFDSETSNFIELQNQIIQLAKDVDKNIYKAKFYFVSGSIDMLKGSDYQRIYSENQGKNSNITNEDRSVYNDYILIQKGLSEEIQSSSNAEEVLGKLQRLKTVGEKIISNKGSFGKDLIKSLKKTSLNEKIELLIKLP
ncbi:MAG: hypothetical protein WDA74_12820 [Spirochaetota bacterium]